MFFPATQRGNGGGSRGEFKTFLIPQSISPQWTHGAHGRFPPREHTWSRTGSLSRTSPTPSVRQPAAARSSDSWETCPIGPMFPRCCVLRIVYFRGSVRRLVRRGYLSSGETPFPRSAAFRATRLL